MTEAEVLVLVRREVQSIQKRNGELPKTPYLWAEVCTRLKTLKPWEGMLHTRSVGRSLRPLVEAVVGNMKVGIPSEDPVTPQHLPPLEAVTALGVKKHRHLRDRHERVSDTC